MIPHSQTETKWILRCQQCKKLFAVEKNHTILDTTTFPGERHVLFRGEEVKYCQPCTKKIARSPIGRVYGRLTVTGKADQPGKWLCQCECGNTAEVHLTNLSQGRTVSCGCRRAELNETRRVQGIQAKIDKLQARIDKYKAELKQETEL